MPRFDIPNYSELSKDDNMKTIKDLKEAKDNLQKEISDKISEFELEHNIIVTDVTVVLDHSSGTARRRIFTLIDIRL